MSYETSGELVRSSILEAIEGGETDHRNEDAAFDNLAELAVEAIRFGAAEEVAGVHRIAEELRSRSIGLGRWKLVDHLDMAIRMLASAARRRRPLPHGLSAADVSILSKLADGPMSCTELAGRTDYAEETVARRLPALRGAGFVVCWKSGRHTINRITEEGRTGLAAAERLAGPVQGPRQHDRGQHFHPAVVKQRIAPRTR